MPCSPACGVCCDIARNDPIAYSSLASGPIAQIIAVCFLEVKISELLHVLLPGVMDARET